MKYPAAPSVSELAEATSPPLFGPGTLGFALGGERLGLGHVEFVEGRGYWAAGPPRFPIVVEVAL